MVFLSSFKDPSLKTVCGLGLAPVCREADGPAPRNGSADGKDIVDEALAFFRANILFKNFEIEGPADITLLYITIFINHCLQKIETESFFSLIQGAKPQKQRRNSWKSWMPAWQNQKIRLLLWLLCSLPTLRQAIMVSDVINIRQILFLHQTDSRGHSHQAASNVIPLSLLGFTAKTEKSRWIISSGVRWRKRSIWIWCTTKWKGESRILWFLTLMPSRLRV